MHLNNTFCLILSNKINSWCLQVQDLVKMLMNIANGMKYLSDMNFVHRVSDV